MAVQKFQIEIQNNPILSYFPGESVYGVLHAIINKDCKHDGIKVTFEGKANVHWTERRDKTTDYFRAEEGYFVYTTDLSGTGNSSQIIPAGEYEYPFQFTLPLGLPASFVSQKGNVWFALEAVMKRSWKINYRARVYIAVNGILDLNVEPGAAQPLDVRKFKHLCCLFCKSGPIGFILKVPRQGYVPGEDITFIAEMSNQSTRRVNGVKIQLLQNVTYHATQKSTVCSKVICEVRGPAVAPGHYMGDSETWTGDVLRIPSLPPTKLENCRIIDIEYCLNFEMEIASPAINLRRHIPIIIGSIPLRNNFQDSMGMGMSGDQPIDNKGFSLNEQGQHSALPDVENEGTFAPKYLTYTWD